MSIGLVIANISAAFRQSPAVPENGGAADGAATANAGTALGNASPLWEPLSGPARLTPGFTVLVLELLNDKGAVTATIPTAQQLAAYRNGTATPPG